MKLKVLQYRAVARSKILGGRLTNKSRKIGGAAAPPCPPSSDVPAIQLRHKKQKKIFSIFSGRICVLHCLLWASEIWDRLRLSKMGRRNGIVYEFCINGLGARLRYLLFVDPAWNIERGQYLFLNVLFVLIWTKCTVLMKKKTLLLRDYSIA